MKGDENAANHRTFPFSIICGGEITGQTLDANNVFHGFLRSADGTMKVLDAPGAGSGAYQGTIASSINDKGAAAGVYFDSSGVAHGFLFSR